MIRRRIKFIISGSIVKQMKDFVRYFTYPIDNKEAGNGTVARGGAARCFGFTVVALMLFLFMASHHSAMALADSSFDNDTMLMFVGEDLEVLSIATRREESASQVPAIAHVITRRQIREQGFDTLSEALASVPGFFMAEKEWGTLPYMRGIPNGILFLYDTVPIGSDMVKNSYFLGNEISLENVKRIEVIRGPGSVLWGPDAFAAIVNIVPVNGKDDEDNEVGVSYETTRDQKRAFVSFSKNTGPFAFSLSMNGKRGTEYDTISNLVQFWDDLSSPVPYEERFGVGKPKTSEYFETVGNASYQDWFNFSGRLSETTRPYALTGEDGSLTWMEERSAKTGFAQIGIKKRINLTTSFRLLGFFSFISPETDIIDRTVSSEEKTSYAELIFDKTFFSGSGLFTGGISYREKKIQDAPVWDGFLYDYLADPENETVFPDLTLQDYHTRLQSIFGQFTLKLGDIDFTLGLRNDQHDSYRSHLSYSLAAVWQPTDRFSIKLLNGTAYRTPSARQLREEASPELENIVNTSLLMTWKTGSNSGMSMCLFNNRIDNHVMDDPYAGLSVPNEQEINGLELEFWTQLHDTLKLSANYTTLENNGPDEVYKYNDISYIGSDGTIEKHYMDLEYPYNSGPESIFNLNVTWRPFERFSLSARSIYSGTSRLIHPRGESFTEGDAIWQTDLTANLTDVLWQGSTLTLEIDNLFDQRFDIPGTYSIVSSKALTCILKLKTTW